MKYKGFEYTLLQTANPTGWKWVVRLDDKRTKVGTAFNKISAMRFAELAIEKLLKRGRASERAEAHAASSEEQPDPPPRPGDRRRVGAP
jgi:hypothetical protein